MEVGILMLIGGFAGLGLLWWLAYLLINAPLNGDGDEL